VRDLPRHRGRCGRGDRRPRERAHRPEPLRHRRPGGGLLEGFRYRPDIVAAGEGGLVWDQASLTAYLQDPAGFLTETLGKNARSGMAYQVRDPAEAANLAAFLAQHGAGG
jgi:cytochrome c2